MSIMKRSIVEGGTILLATVGSQAYGLALPTSDRDIKGVCIAPQDYYYGLKRFYQKDGGWDDPHDPPSGKFPVLEGVKDCTIYELRKFVELAANNNPTILEMLWLKHYEYLSPIGEAMVRNRSLFLSKKAKHTYSGYSHAQLHKVKIHRRWLLAPPLVKPEAKDYGISEGHLPLTKSQMGAFLDYVVCLTRDSIEFMEPTQELRKLLLEDIDLTAIIKQRPLPEDAIQYVQQLTGATNEYMQLLQQTHAYRKALGEWESYQQWKKNRNPERAALEAKCGFDSKHCAHSVRLLRQGLEILTTGELIVDRRDAGDSEELLAIRKGDYTYEQVIAITDDLFAQVEEAYKISTLPHSVDMEQVHELCSGWVQEYLYMSSSGT